MLQLLNGKFSGVVTGAAKGKCWEELAGDVSAASGVMRSVEELKKKWSCLKSGAKFSAVQEKKSLGMTGGGEMVEGVTSSQQRVIAMMGEVCVEGVSGGVDLAELKFSSGMYR